MTVQVVFCILGFVVLRYLNKKQQEFMQSPSCLLNVKLTNIRVFLISSLQRGPETDNHYQRSRFSSLLVYVYDISLKGYFYLVLFLLYLLLLITQIIGKIQFRCFKSFQLLKLLCDAFSC